MKKLIYVCTACGSPRIFADAYVNLNTNEYQTYDTHRCEDCDDDDCNTEEVKVDASFDVDTDTYEPVTKVIFHAHRKSGKVLALFPELPGTNDPNTCNSYMVIGQHSPTHAGMAKGWRLASPEEYAPLLAEVTKVGYSNLRIVKRFTRADRKERINAI